MVGVVHNCRPRPVSSKPDAEAQIIEEDRQEAAGVADRSSAVPLSGAQRHKRWREKHPDLARERARDGMRRRRG